MGNRILLVEADADSRLASSKLLRTHGYEVVEVPSRAEALAACKREKFDLLIGDIRLPDGSGSEVMREVALNCKIKGIALTGCGMEIDVEAALKAGFSDHLMKPVDHDLLLETVARLLTGNSPHLKT